MGQQLDEPAGIGLVDQARAAGARMALQLARFVSEVMTTAGRIGFEAFRCLAKTLRRGPVGFQLGHRLSPVCMATAHKAPTTDLCSSRAPACGRTAQFPKDLVF